MQKIEAKQLIIFFVLWFVFSLVFLELINSFIAAGISVVLVFAGKRLFLQYKKIRKAKLFEKDFAFALMSLHTQLIIGVSYENALKNIAQTDYGIVSEEFAIVLREISQKNSSMQSALFALSERIDSGMVKRGISQMISAYDKGRKEASADIKAIALEFLSMQKNEAKAFSSKIAVLSLMFIVVSAIIPAMFQAFVTVGSMFLELEITPIQLLLIVTVGFPLIDLAMLSYIKLKTPAFLSE
ncbi:MAG: type II secretion system F family protein [archaeon]|nr:type II secretion system F family protein [archaeon]